MPKQPVLYEAMYILDSALDADGMQNVVTALEGHISANGGELVATREFGRRRLAFEIEGHTNGTYMITYFRSHGDLVADVMHEMRLIDGIVRGIVVVANPKAIFEPKKEAPAEAVPAEAAAPAAEAVAPAAEEAPAEEAPAAEPAEAEAEIVAEAEAEVTVPIEVPPTAPAEADTTTAQDVAEDITATEETGEEEA